MNEASKVRLGLIGGTVGTLLASVLRLLPGSAGVAGCRRSVGVGSGRAVSVQTLPAHGHGCISGLELHHALSPEEGMRYRFAVRHPRLMRAQRIAFWAVAVAVVAVVLLPEILPRLLLA